MMMRTVCGWVMAALMLGLCGCEAFEEALQESFSQDASSALNIFGEE